MKLHTKKVNKAQRKAILNRLLDNPQVQPMSYNMQVSYDLGDFLLHPKYGPGFVERLIDTDKIQVFFGTVGRDEAKILLHNRSA